ncbi:hypothetical protein SAMN05216516_1023 [Izhakiella capsodis]|uniref:Tox-PLDMTX domain-containing protein n=1 Tax=Izhakiella capsodis TaxID=1367852 RepID=A0A1I4VQ88_9GAMM|nr:hypothetical protein SAMN05216516_1023 [Izhakiella capsodis]
MFRRKGHNAQIPSVNMALAVQLREAIANARESGVSPATLACLSDADRSRAQLETLDDFTRRLSDNAQRWVNHQLGVIHGDKKYAPANRAAGQQLAERLNSALRMLKNIVDVLFPAGGTAADMSDDAAGLHAEPHDAMRRFIQSLFSEAKSAKEAASAPSGNAPSFFRELAEYFTTLGAELSSAFSPNDSRLYAPDPASVRRLHDAVTDDRALLNITVSTESPFGIPWTRKKLNAIGGLAARLSEENVRRWVSHEQAIKNTEIYPSLLMPLNSVVQTLTDITEALLSPDSAAEFSTFSALLKTAGDQAKATASIVAHRQGSSSDFFRDVSQFLETLHQEMKSVSVSQPSRCMDWFDKKGAQAAILLARAGTLRARLHGALLNLVPALNPAMTSERLTAESIVRGILWSWQQTAIKFRDSSRSLYVKAVALQPLQDRVLPAPTLSDRVNLAGPGTAAGRAAAQPPTTDGAVQKKSAGPLGEKMAVLTQWLDTDIAGARTLLARQGKTTEEVARTLRQQRFAVLKMTHQHLSGAAPYLQTLDTLLPEFAARLAGAGSALDKAITAAGDRAPNYREAKERAGEALLLVTQAEKELSCTAANMTGRPLDEYARGARLARHWAQIAREKMPQDWVAADAGQTLALLKRYGLTDGVLSAGDPQGYLFATRLAAEFENARRGELKPPVSPAQYAGLEKGLTEYMVKWGQQRASSGAARLVVTLSFDALGLVVGLSALTSIALRTVKDVIRIPYAAHQLKKFTMPGEDIPFRAINSLLEKKLKQLGFKLATTPLPGALKFATGGAITALARMRNCQLEGSENSFEAIYERVTEGKQSGKIKMASAGQMLADAVLSGATTAGFKGANRALEAGMNAPGIGNTSVPSDAERQSMTGGAPAGAAKQALSASAEAFAGSGDREEEAHPRSRGKRSTEAQNAPAGAERDDVLVFDYYSFCADKKYYQLSSNHKTSAYFHAINYLLYQIENDKKLSEQCRSNARMARAGALNVTPLDIDGYPIINTLFLPDTLDSKRGVVIHLNVPTPYYYVSKGEDILPVTKYSLPYNRKESRRTFHQDGGWIPSPSVEQRLESLKKGSEDFNTYFNSNNSAPMTIADLAKSLRDTAENDFSHTSEKFPSNKQLLSRAMVGTLVPEPDFKLTSKKYTFSYSWNHLEGTDFLRGIAHPFAKLSRMVELIIDRTLDEPLIIAERDADRAETIGTWIDITVSAAGTFTRMGKGITVIQASAEVDADLIDGKTPHPLAVASIITAAIPNEALLSSIARVSRPAAKTLEYTLLIGNKSIDLAIVGQSIKEAYDTGEPLAIYQALVASGLSIRDSYAIAKRISLHTKVNKPLEHTVSLEDLEALEKLEEEYTVSARVFKIGNSELLGKIDAGVIKISKDNGATWEQGSDLHKLAYRLQNAGGRPAHLCPGLCRTPETSFGLKTEHHVMLNTASRFVLNYKLGKQKIQSFDLTAGKFKNSSDFTLARTGHSTSRVSNVLSADALSTSIQDMNAVLNRLNNALERYPESDKKNIIANFKITEQALNNIRRNDRPEDSVSDTSRSSNHQDSVSDVSSDFKPNVSTYSLIKKGTSPDAINKSYGLVNAQYNIGNSDISILYLTAHPYVIVNKYPKFKDYLISQGLVSAATLNDYNIRNVARFLGTEAVSSEIGHYDTIPGGKVESISFNASNPITQRMGYQLEKITKLLTFKRYREGEYFDDVSLDGEVQHTQQDPLQEAIDRLKQHNRVDFSPVKPLEEISSEATQEKIARMMHGYDTTIREEKLDLLMRSDLNTKMPAYCRDAVKSINRAFIKVSQVKQLFDAAALQPQIKAELKNMLNEATGLNDEMVIDLGMSQRPISDISEMVYRRFKENVTRLFNFLSKQKTDNYSAIALVQYNLPGSSRPNASRPNAFGLLYNGQPRIFLPVGPEVHQPDGQANAPAPDVAHNVSDHRDGVRDKNGSFLNAFEFSTRDDSYLFADERISKLSTNYALGLKEDAATTELQENIAKSLLAYSRVVKADTLLSMAEHNAFMINVLSHYHTQGERIWRNEDTPAMRRDDAIRKSDFDNSFIQAALDLTLHEV